MVSISEGMSADNAGTYYKAHYSAAAEYYAPTEGPSIGEAVGKGAEALGLSGAVTAEHFESLLHGLHPETGAVLRAKASRAGAEERAGFDITFSPPKSISIQALVAGDTRLIGAAREAALYTIKEAERCAFARQHGGKEWVQTSNICAVVFEHYDARESINSQHGPDPQLHHHTFVTNLTQRPDKQWRALEAEQIYRDRPHMDAIYMGELARNVQQLGYQITRGSDGSFELAGFTRAQIEAFSERTRDIERAKAQNGITNARAAKEITIQTRKAKREHDPDTLKAERLALATSHGIDTSYRPSFPVRTFPTTPELQAQKSLAFALDHATNRQAVADNRVIELAALRHGIGATDLAHVRQQLASERQRGNAIPTESTYRYPIGAHTTKTMVQLELENLALVRDTKHGRPICGIAIRSGVDGTLSSTGKQEVAKWASAKGLLSDQTDAAILTLTTPRWASAIEGLAGTTKTTTVGAVKEFAEQHGWTVHGFGTTSGSRDALIKAGIDSRTIAKALATALPQKTAPELWIVDESSLLATRPVNQLLKLARDRGVERMLFVGDQQQHLAIEAGSPVRQFLADNMVVAQLTTIRRQKDPELRKAILSAAHQEIGKAIDLLVEQKRVTEVPDTAKRYERIAADYLQAHEAGQGCLVVSPANDERRALNEAIRSKLMEHRYVATIGQEHQILIPRDMTPPQLQHPHSYHEGDIVYFSRGSKAQQIPKQAYLTVAATSDESVTLRAQNGRLLQFDPTRWKGLTVYTPESRTIAIGDRLEWREPDNKRGIANHQFATITNLDARNIEVKFESGRKLSMPLTDARKVDLGYASTSHAAQGTTVQRCIMNIDSSRSADLVNQRQFYVGGSRPELELRIYTDSIERMRRAVSRTQDKELALDVVQKRQQRQQSAGIRI